MSKGRNFPTINLTDFIIVRKTDEQYTKNLIKYWKEGGMTNLTVSLSCPISKTRLEMPCRGEDCTHIQCFDGLNFLKMNEKQFGKWLCNICQKPSPLNKLFVDGLFLDILKTVSDNIENIYFDMDGNWTDSNPDSKSSKLDYSVIDLSETLEVIDLTGSDDDDNDDNKTPGTSTAVSPKAVDNADKADKSKTTPGNSTADKSKNTPGNSKADKSKTTPRNSIADKSKTTPGKCTADKSKTTPGSSTADKGKTTPGNSTADESKTTHGNSENDLDVNTAERQELSNKAGDTNEKQNDKEKNYQKGNRDKEGDSNKENNIVTWYRGMNTNYHAIRNQRHNNKTQGLPYARRYPQRKNYSSNAFYSTQRQYFRKPLHQHNPYCNVDYNVPFCQQTMMSWFSGNVTSLDFGNKGNFSIRIQL